jgi:hypothetical protein
LCIHEFVETGVIDCRTVGSLLMFFAICLVYLCFLLLVGTSRMPERAWADRLLPL